MTDRHGIAQRIGVWRQVPGFAEGCRENLWRIVVKPKPEQTPAHWSKDFVEHLRTVHFTLIALCLGLIVLAFFPSKFDIQVARDEATEIFEAANKWDENFLTTYADESIRADPEALQLNDRFKPVGFPDLSGSVSEPGFTQLMHSVFDDRFWIGSFVVVDKGPKFDMPLRIALTFKSRYWRAIDVQRPSELRSPDVSEDQISESFRSPQNLKEFRLLWDWSLRPISVTIPSEPESCRVIFSDKNYSSKCSVTTTSSELWEEMKGGTRNDTIGDAYFSSSQGDTPAEFIVKPVANAPIKPDFYLKIEVPVKSVRVLRLDPQRVLLRRFSSWANKYKMPFKEAFRELAAVDEPFETADLESAKNILAADAEREGDSFEAVGMKIPAEIAVQFGALFVLGVQLYMWIHLHEFGNRIERAAGFDVAWIGVYDSHPARFVFLSTLLVLPWTTVVILSYKWLHLRSDHRPSWWAIAIAANVASLLLTYLIFRVLPKATSETPESATDLGSMD
jgi:hypothetical protein